MSKCESCKYFKILYGPLKCRGGVYDQGRAICEKYGFVKDYTSRAAFKYLKCPDEEADNENNRAAGH